MNGENPDLCHIPDTISWDWANSCSTGGNDHRMYFRASLFSASSCDDILACAGVVTSVAYDAACSSECTGTHGFASCSAGGGCACPSGQVFLRTGVLGCALVSLATGNSYCTVGSSADEGVTYTCCPASSCPTAADSCHTSL